MHNLQVKFFDAVSKGQTGVVRKLITQGVNVNAKDKADGMTALLKAAKRRNYVMQKILLSNGAKTTAKDRDGLTALHYEAESGDIESVMLLLAHQSPMDRKNNVGCTPLHYAANRKQFNVVDLLVFCGADPFIENELKQTVLSVCEDVQIIDILQNSLVILNGIRNNDIFIQNVELYGNVTYEMATLDLTVYTPKTFNTNSLSFLCRRIRPEYNTDQNLNPERSKKELLISDTFEYRISSTHMKTDVKMKIPLYSKPDPYEEIHIKTNTGLHMLIDEYKLVTNPKCPSKLKWYGFADIDLSKMSAFCLVTRPKIEKFACDNRKDIFFTSTVDRYVQCVVPRGSFRSENSVVSLELVPSPPYEEEDFKEIISVSHFYDINHNKKEQPKGKVTMSIPLPQDYDGEGDLYVLGATIDSDYYYRSGYEDGLCDDLSLGSWSVVGINPDLKKGKIEFRISHFSQYVASECKTGMDETDVIQQTAELSARASMRKKHVCFLVLLRPLGNGRFDVVVEVINVRKATQRFDYWMSQQFLDQKPSETRCFEAIPKSKYIIQLSSNVVKEGGSSEVKLEYHPKRKNFQKFQIRIAEIQTSGKSISRKSGKSKEKEDGSSSDVQSETLSENSETDESYLNKKTALVKLYEVENEEEEYTEELARMLIKLTGTPFLDQPSNFGDDDERGFTHDKLLKHIAKEMKSEWMKVCVLAGLTYQTVEDYRKNTKLSEIEKKLQILQVWRDMSRLRVDLGIPDLVTALARVGRKDLVSYVNEQLKTWLTEKREQSDRFRIWLEEAFNGPDKKGLEHETTPEPMSDQFFVMLVDKFGIELQEVGGLLNMSGPEMRETFADSLNTSDEHKLLKDLGEKLRLCPAELQDVIQYPVGHGARLIRMLVVAREKCTTSQEAFKNLIQALTQLKFKEARSWLLDTSKTWLAEKKVRDPFSQEILELVEEAEGVHIEDNEEVSCEKDHLDIPIRSASRSVKRESFSVFDSNNIPARSASRMGASRQQMYGTPIDDNYASDSNSEYEARRGRMESPTKQKITFMESHDSDSGSEYGVHHTANTPTFQRDKLAYRRESDASFRSGVAYTPLPDETSLIFHDDELGETYHEETDSHVSDMEEEFPLPKNDFPDNESYVSGRSDIFTPLPGDPEGMAFIRDDTKYDFGDSNSETSQRSVYDRKDNKGTNTGITADRFLTTAKFSDAQSDVSETSSAKGPIPGAERKSISRSSGASVEYPDFKPRLSQDDQDDKMSTGFSPDDGQLLGNSADSDRPTSKTDSTKSEQYLDKIHKERRSSHGSFHGSHYSANSLNKDKERSRRSSRSSVASSLSTVPDDSKKDVDRFGVSGGFIITGQREPDTASVRDGDSKSNEPDDRHSIHSPDVSYSEEKTYKDADSTHTPDNNSLNSQSSTTDIKQHSEQEMPERDAEEVHTNVPETSPLDEDALRTLKTESDAIAVGNESFENGGHEKNSQKTEEIDPGDAMKKDSNVKLSSTDVIATKSDDVENKNDDDHLRGKDDMMTSSGHEVDQKSEIDVIAQPPLSEQESEINAIVQPVLDRQQSEIDAKVQPPLNEQQSEYDENKQTAPSPITDSTSVTQPREENSVTENVGHTHTVSDSLTGSASESQSLYENNDERENTNQIPDKTVTNPQNETADSSKVPDPSANEVSPDSSTTGVSSPQKLESSKEAGEETRQPELPLQPPDIGEFDDGSDSFLFSSDDDYEYGDEIPHEEIHERQRDS